MLLHHTYSYTLLCSSVYYNIILEIISIRCIEVNRHVTIIGYLLEKHEMHDKKTSIREPRESVSGGQFKNNNIDMQIVN